MAKKPATKKSTTKLRVLAALCEGLNIVEIEFKPFLSILILFVISLLLIPLVGHNYHDYVGYLIFLVFVVELPLLVVISRDALFELNTSKKGNIPIRVLVRIVASLPSIIFGLTGLCIGLAIILWVLYNILIETLPQYSGTMLLPSLGIGPALVFWGYSTLKSIFGLEYQAEDLDEESEG